MLAIVKTSIQYVALYVAIVQYAVYCTAEPTCSKVLGPMPVTASKLCRDSSPPVSAAATTAARTLRALAVFSLFGCSNTAAYSTALSTIQHKRMRVICY
jgi:hypothetical protein